MQLPYGFWFEYGRDKLTSATGGGVNTREEAIQGARKALAYYQDLGYNTFQMRIYKTCPNCEWGHIRKRHKRTGRVLSKKPCPKCQGTGELDVEELEV